MFLDVRGGRRQQVGQIDQGHHCVLDGHKARQEADKGRLRDLRHGPHLRWLERDDVEHTISQQTDLAVADLDNDNDVEGRRLGHTLAEATTQIDYRHDNAAQIEYATDVIGLLWQVRDL